MYMDTGDYDEISFDVHELYNDDEMIPCPNKGCTWETRNMSGCDKAVRNHLDTECEHNNGDDDEQGCDCHRCKVGRSDLGQ